VADIKNKVKTTTAAIPAWSDETSTQFLKAVQSSTLSADSATLKKTVDACKRCSGLAGLQFDFKDADAVVKESFTVVASCSVSLLIPAKSWSEVNAESIKKKDSKTQKLFNSMQDIHKVIVGNSLELPPSLNAQMSDKLALGNRPAAAASL
jgi:excinuclease UvrABC ATPase subunit